MTTANPARTSRPASSETDPSPELLNALESDTQTLTGAVADGTVTLEEVDRFARRAECGDVDCHESVDEVVRIVCALLRDEPGWAEMEPAGSPVRV
ncbi:hypothetical protein EXE46_01375 [Halorubrum sp. GN11_10-6_MGM]|uniref:hypothetical protein n=1 Tax=Halorubrum sp. GN11_10-6_MGM TaxID=2518112 RepID=UPI0010F7EB9D|nr:hypothetical protein [Halorubrum sp. GN11_10-6_MGM]TKX75774.1 hypothetical protein EXE46_01375 [Halorubrum sp. GN11_10-6_MGM]